MRGLNPVMVAMDRILDWLVILTASPEIIVLLAYFAKKHRLGWNKNLVFVVYFYRIYLFVIGGLQR